MTDLLAVDGNFLLFQAFHASPDHLEAGGEPTGATFLFTRKLTALLREHRPARLVVCFDRPEPTFRHEANPLYKAQRDAPPPALITQMGQTRRLLDALSIPRLETPGFEADDLLATVAHQASAAQLSVVVATGDRDAFQLVSDPYVRLHYIKQRSDEVLLLDEAGVLEHTGVTPADYPQFAAMRGDPSDNLDGIVKVGPKKAADLMNRFGSLEAVIAHADDLTPALRQNVLEGADRARANVDLMTLRVDTPVDLEADVPPWTTFEPAVAAETFTTLGMGNALRSLGDVMAGTPVAEPIAAAVEQLGGSDDPGDNAAELVVPEPVLPPDVDAAVAAVGRLAALAAAAAAPLSLAVEPPLDPDEAGLGLLGADNGWLALAAGADDELELCCLNPQLAADATVAVAVRDALTASGFNTFSTKALLTALDDRCGSMGVGAGNLRVDVAIAGFLTATTDRTEDLADLLRRCCGTELPPQEDSDQPALSGDPAGSESEPDAPRAANRDEPGALDDHARAVVAELATEAAAVAALSPQLELALTEAGMESLYEDLERPLIWVLHRMERAGVRVDGAELSRQLQALTVESDSKKAAVFESSGQTFKLNSPKELGKVLFEDLGLTPGTRTKTGFSTNATVLEAIRHEHEVVNLVLGYREAERLRTTVEKSLLPAVGVTDSRIHASFSQTVARTGRLSSDSPNLHNVPVRSEAGRKIRRAFVPHDGQVLLVADYNQIELRILAHLAGDPGLVDAFRSGQDIHTTTAAQLFDVEAEAVSTEQRSTAKMVSYGLAYGMEAFGLGQRLNVPTDEAADILNNYFTKFPKVKAYMDKVVADCKEHGYTSTEFGRRRYIPAVHARHHQARQAAERQAMNAPVQGLAADIFKVALVELDWQLLADGLATRLILQVHDEVILEVPPDELDAAKSITSDVMVGAGSTLTVPLEVNLAVGDSWADAKP